MHVIYQMSYIIDSALYVAKLVSVVIIVRFYIQIRYRAESVSANEIANGILSSLVAITAGCAFVDYWGACLIGRELLQKLIMHWIIVAYKSLLHIQSLRCCSTMVDATWSTSWESKTLPE